MLERLARILGLKPKENNMLAESIMAFLQVLAIAMGKRGHHDLADFAVLANGLVREGDAGLDELREITSDMQAMVNESRGPTTAEREKVADRRRALSARLQALSSDGAVAGGPTGLLGDPPPTG